MRHHARRQLIAVAAAMLDGARQCRHMEWISVRRMLREITEVLPLISEPSYRPHRESITRTLAALQRESAHTPRATALLDELLDELGELRQAAEAERNLTATVVFMPYNAAMWDSLHSIWQAAEADPRCKAVVVPIPYVDRNPDGSVAQLHDHTKLLPREVPVTPHQKFDLARVHPDVIYIHNPYDGFNRVTSVLPDYYTEKLRPHTEMLVYVPYHVTDHPLDEHFDKFSAFQLCDKVIAQSETFAQNAIAVWSSNKVVPLGSPKFDYVLNATGGAVPREWAERTAGRNVLLQVTSLATFLNNGPAAIDKLHDVLDATERCDDVVLWWRPHPLERATFASMLPALREAYERYAARAAASPRVVVDDTVDLQRAISTADAYYGHGSSVVPLFGITGKPLIVQDPETATDVAREPVRDDEVGPGFPFAGYLPGERQLYEGTFAYLRRMIAEHGGDVPGQRTAYATLAANSDGTAGQHIHDYVMSCL